jgi:hypothetical protein
MGVYKHAEAFCLMLYVAEDGSGEQEIIWNSRDGVTPFVISLRSGKTALHENWKADRCVPDFVPAPGSRMFVDLTPEKAREYAETNLEVWAADEKAREYGRLPTVEELVREYLRMPGQPDLVEVPAD